VRALALVLALTASAHTATAALVRDELLQAEAHVRADQGLADRIAPMLAGLLDAARPDLVAVMVGPGSFTGLRAAIAVAQGIGLALGCPVVGATASEAFAADGGTGLAGRTLWTAMDSRRGRIFLDQGAGFAACPADALPYTRERVAIAGDAANEVAAALAARGTDVMLTRLRQPSALAVGLAGARLAAGAPHAVQAVPLYVDAPEARAPAGGLRPQPA
jgi:tRNA threonylcarbamoyl adenosine modification protein YeaZ